MAAYVTVPKDLTNIKTKVIGSFTKRQCICFGIGVAIAFPVYFAVRGTIGQNAAFYILMAILAPFFLVGTMEKNGMPLEKYLYYYIKHKLVNPPIRVCYYEPLYSFLGRMATEEEMRKGEGYANRKKMGGFGKKYK